MECQLAEREQTSPSVSIQHVDEHLILKRVDYSALNARQKENYNYQKLSSILADFGFITHRLSDDWNGADLIAQHIHEDVFLKIQLKGRLTFAKKYQGKDILIAFREGDEWFLYPHDPFLAFVLSVTNIANTESWKEEGGYSFSRLSEPLLSALSRYRLKPQAESEVGLPVVPA